jgi:GT2 family glycosyltransferase
METLSTPENHVDFAKKDNSGLVDIGVVVVSWNVKDALIKNLESLYASRGRISARIIVIDNASGDGTVQELTARFPEVVLIANKENAGFAKAVNQGIKTANSRHVLLLNPDMTVMSDALQKTTAYLDGHADVGVLGARLSRTDGTVFKSVRRLPDFKSQLATMLKLSRIFPALTQRYLMTDFDYGKEQDAPSVRGSYFAMSENALKKIPLLDERYFIWFEEVDYCHAISRAGLKVRYMPEITAIDLASLSFKQRKLSWKQKHFTKSMAQYFWKWQPGLGAAAISILRFPVVCAAWLHDLFV